MRERLTFEREIGLLVPSDEVDVERARETEAGLRRKLNFLSFLPHRTQQGGKDVELTPAVVDPKIYDGPEKYLIAQPLQDCLMTVMRKPAFAHIKVALVDLTKGVAAPEFAGYFHKQQLFVASVAKIAVMLAAFQLRHDLRMAVGTKKPGTLAALFESMRDDWAATQRDPGGKLTPFARSIQVRSKLVLVGGSKIGLQEPKAPRVETVFASVPKGAVSIEFNKSGESRAVMKSLVDQFNLTNEKKALKEAADELKAAQGESPRNAVRIRDATKAVSEAKTKLKAAKAKRPDVDRKIRALGFWERLGIAVGGDVPASNLATSTVVHDIGFHYIASTLLQSGLYDSNRNGGLWLGADYWSVNWRSGPTGGVPQSATAGALVAFMTLMSQDALVSPEASQGMWTMMQKRPTSAFPGTGSWFEEGLRSLSPKTVLAKVGLAGGADELALIERDVETEVQHVDGTKTKKTTTVRYVVAALRARDGDELHALIRELDKCILVNDGLA